MGSIWGRFGVDLGSAWGRFGIDLGSVWDQFGIDLGSVRDRFGVDLANLGENLGVFAEILSGKVLSGKVAPPMDYLSHQVDMPAKKAREL